MYCICIRIKAWSIIFKAWSSICLNGVARVERIELECRRQYCTRVRTPDVEFRGALVPSVVHQQWREALQQPQVRPPVLWRVAQDVRVELNSGRRQETGALKSSLSIQRRAIVTRSPNLQVDIHTVYWTSIYTRIISTNEQCDAPHVRELVAESERDVLAHCGRHVGRHEHTQLAVSNQTPVLHCSCRRAHLQSYWKRTRKLNICLGKT